MDIIEGNFLIAKFMGYTYPDIKNEVWMLSLDLHDYSGDWRLLMPVVEKIESIIDSGSVGILNTECLIMVYYNHKIHATAETKIEATWKAVIDFIQWYNRQPSSVK